MVVPGLCRYGLGRARASKWLWPRQKVDEWGRPGSCLGWWVGRGPAPSEFTPRLQILWAWAARCWVFAGLCCLGRCCLRRSSWRSRRRAHLVRTGSLHGPLGLFMALAGLGLFWLRPRWAATLCCSVFVGARRSRLGAAAFGRCCSWRSSLALATAGASCAHGALPLGLLGSPWLWPGSGPSWASGLAGCSCCCSVSSSRGGPASALLIWLDGRVGSMAWVARWLDAREVLVLVRPPRRPLP